MHRPFLEATEDTNEGTGAALPFLRSLDAFNQADPAIRIIASGGVTTSLVLPGSSNLMGGEAFAFKMRVPESNSAEDMLLNAGLVEEVDGETGWRWMKMACGEGKFATGDCYSVPAAAFPFSRVR
ncbi:MAG: hypothetical protein BJ554DRAFT_6157 [Olpidium bornovanus]|uniref:Uncharacterized protein n=1 Tax=Olpidium bornovanus TaxID=278681 RepID=A0A8H7ZYD3_9FUNG|nr:MAG: hypothetical protein BJ554DRAFT_6157 [Olpidium bornovanus]